MNIEARNKIISIVLAIVIVVLAFWLYDSLVTPYQTVVEQQEITERVRDRMNNVKNVLVRYEATLGNFPPTEGGLDSVIQFAKEDSSLRAQADSMFVDSQGRYSIDSLTHSPRGGERFRYTLNDTLRPPIYLLEDPNSDDVIGSLSRTTMRNSPNW